MKKKGQIALFMAIGVVLLIIVILMIFLGARTRNPISAAPLSYEQYSPIENYVSSCLRSAALKNIYEVGAFGGYTRDGIATLDKKISYVDYTVPIYYEYYPDRSIDLEYSRTEESIKKVVVDPTTDDFLECVNFSIFYKQGYSIIPDSYPKLRLNFDENEVKLGLNYAINITKDKSIGRIESFEIKLPIHVNKIREDIKKIRNYLALPHPNNVEPEKRDIGWSGICPSLKIKNTSIEIFPIPPENQNIYIIRFTDYSPSAWEGYNSKEGLVYQEYVFYVAINTTRNLTGSCN